MQNFIQLSLQVQCNHMQDLRYDCTCTGAMLVDTDNKSVVCLLNNYSSKLCQTSSSQQTQCLCQNGNYVGPSYNESYFYCSNYGETKNWADSTSTMLTNCKLGGYVSFSGQACLYCPDGEFCYQNIHQKCPDQAICNSSAIVNCTGSRFISKNKFECLPCIVGYFCDGVSIFCPTFVKNGTNNCTCMIDGSQHLDLNGICADCLEKDGIQQCQNGFIVQCLSDFYLLYVRDTSTCYACPDGAWCENNSVYCFHNIKNGTMLGSIDCHCHDTNQYIDADKFCQPCLGVCQNSRHLICPNASQYVDQNRHCNVCPPNSICDGITNFCQNNIRTGLDGCVCQNDGTQYEDVLGKCQYCNFSGNVSCNGSNVILCLNNTKLGFENCVCEFNLVMPAFDSGFIVCVDNQVQKCDANEYTHLSPCACEVTDYISFNGSSKFYCTKQCELVPDIYCDRFACQHTMYVSTADSHICMMCPHGMRCNGTYLVLDCGAQNGQYCFNGSNLEQCPTGAQCTSGNLNCSNGSSLGMSDFYKSCKVCNNSNGGLCNGTEIISCSGGFLPTIMQCIPCNDSVSCFNNSKRKCPGQCQEGILKKCSGPLKTYKSSSLDEICGPCPQNAICNGTNIFVCKETFNKKLGFCICPSDYHINHSMRCQSCPQYGVCNGIIIVSCNNGYVLFEQKCQCRGEKYKSNQGICTICPLKATCLNGQVISCSDQLFWDQIDEKCQCDNGFAFENQSCICLNGKYIAGEQCKKCPTYGDCDGQNFIGCRNGFDKVDESCICSEFIQNDTCTDCPAHAKCDGSSFFKCDDTFTRYADPNSCQCNEDNQQYLYDNFCRCYDEDSYLDILALFCLGCPQKEACNGTHIVSCPWGEEWNPDRRQCQIIDTTCYDCRVKSGNCSFDLELQNLQCTEETICEENYDIKTFCRNCLPGFAIEDLKCVSESCNTNEYFSSITQVCQECPLYGTCDGTHQVICNKGFQFDLQTEQCLCLTNKFISKKFECLDCPLNASCDNGILKCQDSFVLQPDEESCACLRTQYLVDKKCVSCPLNAICDGDRIIGCTQGFSLKNNSCQCFQGSFINATGFCETCPPFGFCDGKDIVNCSNNYDLLDTKCVCADAKIIDRDQKCSICPQYAQCGGNKILSCADTFIIGNKNDSCECKNNLVVIKDRCQCESSQFVDKGDGCSKCPTNAICDGVNAKCIDPNFEFANDICKPIIKNCTDCQIAEGRCQQIGNNYSCDYGTFCIDGFDIKQHCRFCLDNYELIDSKCVLQYCADASQFIFEGECQDCDINGICDGKIIICKEGFYLRDGKDCILKEIPDDPGDNKIGGWAIAAIVIGVIILVSVIVLAGFCCYKKCKKEKYVAIGGLEQQADGW